MTIVADQNTDEMNGKRPFEERVFARFDAVDARLNTVDARFDTVNERFDVVDSSILNLDSRLEKLEVRAYDTKPIWEQAIKEIVDTSRELSSVWIASMHWRSKPALTFEMLKIALIRLNLSLANNTYAAIELIPRFV